MARIEILVDIDFHIQNTITSRVPHFLKPLLVHNMRSSLRVLSNVVRTMSTTANPIEKLIQSKLETAFNPSFMEIINESYKHNVPKGAESHFKVVVVSTEFEGKSLIQRHRSVNQTLSNELKNSIHALSIQAMTPEQWEKDSTVSKTPNCLGGHK